MKGEKSDIFFETTAVVSNGGVVSIMDMDEDSEGEACVGAGADLRVIESRRHQEK